MIKPQSEFPLIKKAKANFPVNGRTCFTYGEDFFCDVPMTEDLIIHEQVHVLQQREIGAYNWWMKFFNDERFRLEQEIPAYRKQLASIKDRNKRFKYMLQIVEALSAPGGLYGMIINKEDAMERLRI